MDLSENWVATEEASGDAPEGVHPESNFPTVAGQAPVLPRGSAVKKIVFAPSKSQRNPLHAHRKYRSCRALVRGREAEEGKSTRQPLLELTHDVVEEEFMATMRGALRVTSQETLDRAHERSTRAARRARRPKPSYGRSRRERFGTCDIWDRGFVAETPGVQLHTRKRCLGEAFRAP